MCLQSMEYEHFIEEMCSLADEPGRTHLLKLKETLHRVAPELMPHLFWERITAICNMYFHSHKQIRAIFQKAAEWQMDKQRIGI